MKTNLQQLVITLDQVEADSLRRDLDTVRTRDPELIPYNSKLAELHHVLKLYGGKT